LAARSRERVEALVTDLAADPAAGRTAEAVDRVAGRTAEVVGRVEGAARRTGEVTAGAPRLTVEAGAGRATLAAAGRAALVARGRAALVAGRGRGVATRWAAVAALPSVEVPDPVARPANESTSLAVAFKVVRTGSRSRGSRRSAASAGRDDRSSRRPPQNANRHRRSRSRRVRGADCPNCTRSNIDLQ
jgi:hypothetical protein